ncbi:MAG: sulfite exporter TauE/SafE family protein [Candidatus Brocadiaceae bacterium]
MELWHYVIIFPIGILVGIINTLAGGGSLLTLPILIFLGLPVAVANGTNRLAIAAQNICAVAGFRKKGFANFRLSLLMAGPSLAGAFIGALIAVDIPDLLFKRILAIVILIVFGLILWSPAKRKYKKIIHSNYRDLESWKSLITLMVTFFFIGIYSGFIQAGVGIIIMAALTTMNLFNLVETNSHKVFVIGMNALFTVFVFAFYNKICWPVGLVLATGNGIGGLLGSYLAISVGERFIRVVLIIVTLAMAIKLLT